MLNQLSLHKTEKQIFGERGKCPEKWQCTTQNVFMQKKFLSRWKPNNNFSRKDSAMSGNSHYFSGFCNVFCAKAESSRRWKPKQMQTITCVGNIQQSLGMATLISRKRQTSGNNQSGKFSKLADFARFVFVSWEMRNQRLRDFVHGMLR